ncbi:mesothelin-like [Triplophysa rosa]|uniref:mesothelin-like n=1 Tax=Triplophysa rosa TaxID=992332 RepID=UPI002545D036|nr:mesothelin-like [Triplophysa rosa]
MDSRNGEWDPEMVQLIVSKYLSVSGNRLGSSELNSLGSNICALNTSVLNNIAAASIEKATALPMTNCTSEQKRIVFGVAQSAFSVTNRRGADAVSLSTYQLLQSYLGGADITFVRKLVNSNVNMDLITFMSLEQSVINVLNVMDVKSLLGVSVGDLKTYDSASQVQQWIKLQLQTDLDTLKISLTGGRNATVTTAVPSASNSTTKAPSGQNSTVTAAGGNTVAASTTKGGVSRVYAPVCLQLILLAVTVQLLH